ncbi:hypothetical protein [Cellulomonas endophytica]|uniref:hypothetical protein n=1 Tax=Cellulomonas endophytica TaxID=2494735 RepID=UPI0010114B7F|nr:hypothetical protein [Cellulomonas endophytica]
MSDGAPDDGVREPVAADDEVRWVAFVRADHRTGTVAALAGVFATRGVNFDGLSAGEAADEPGWVVVSFRATPRRCRVLERSVGRLAAVHGVVVHRADDPAVRAVAVLHEAPGTGRVPAAGAAVRWSGDGPLVVEGPLAEVERAVAAAHRDGVRTATLVVPPPDV